MGVLNSRNLLFHSSVSWKSEMKVLAGLLPMRTMRENLLHASRLASVGFIAVFGIP